jgi:hypothetical protein
MRRIETTNVNVQVNDRTDRQNVVATLRTSLRCLRLFLREACSWLVCRVAQLGRPSLVRRTWQRNK